MRQKLEQELSAWKRRLEANKKNNLQAGIAKAEREISNIESQLAELDAKEAVQKDMDKEKSKKKKTKKDKKSKGMKVLIQDKPTKSLEEIPDCEELLKRHKENAKKRIESAKKRAAKPVSQQIVEKVETTADSVETKIEKLKDEGKKLGEDATKKLELYTSQFIKSIESAIQNESLRKEYIKGLIAKLQKLL